MAVTPDRGRHGSRPEILRILDETVRRHCRFINSRIERLDRVTRVTSPSPALLGNLVFWSDLDDSNADQVIDEQVDYFTGIGHDFEWIVYGHDQPDDLVERLLRRGFEPESEEIVVIAEPASIESADPPDGVTLQAIESREQIADVIAVQRAVWGSEGRNYVTRWLTRLVEDHRDEGIVVVAYANEAPVGAAWATWWKDRPIAPLFGGSVIPEWRRRGIYRAMVSMRIEAAADRGISWCLVDAGSESRPILERIGFEPLTPRTSLRWKGNPD